MSPLNNEYLKYTDDKKISKVLETVGPNGEELEGSAGRLINPGHVIEAGWFLMQHGNKFKVKIMIIRLKILIERWEKPSS